MNPMNDPGDVKVRVDAYEGIHNNRRRLLERVTVLNNHVDQLRHTLFDFATKAGMSSELAVALLAEIAEKAGDNSYD